MKISSRMQKLVVAKENPKEITFDQLLAKFDKKDYFFLIILLAIPPATPFSFIPGFSALFGFLIALICVQLLIGRNKIWLPSKLKDKKIPDEMNKGIKKIIPYIKLLEQYIKKRIRFLSSNFVKYIFIFFILILSILLMLPTPYVDFVSSCAIIMISIGIIEQDGLLLISVFFIVLIYILLLFYILRGIIILSYKVFTYIKSLITI